MFALHMLGISLETLILRATPMQAPDLPWTEHTMHHMFFFFFYITADRLRLCVELRELNDPGSQCVADRRPGGSDDVR